MIEEHEYTKEVVKALLEAHIELANTYKGDADPIIRCPLCVAMNEFRAPGNNLDHLCNLCTYRIAPLNDGISTPYCITLPYNKYARSQRNINDPVLRRYKRTYHDRMAGALSLYSDNTITFEEMVEQMVLNRDNFVKKAEKHVQEDEI